MTKFLVALVLALFVSPALAAVTVAITSGPTAPIHLVPSVGPNPTIHYTLTGVATRQYCFVDVVDPQDARYGTAFVMGPFSGALAVGVIAPSTALPPGVYNLSLRVTCSPTYSVVARSPTSVPVTFAP